MSNDLARGIEGVIELKARARQQEQRIYELQALAQKLLAYCDGATHQDEQYSDERSALIDAVKAGPASAFADTASALKGLVATIGELPENGAGVLQGLELNRAYMEACRVVEWYRL